MGIGGDRRDRVSSPHSKGVLQMDANGIGWLRFAPRPMHAIQLMRFIRYLPPALEVARRARLRSFIYLKGKFIEMHRLQGAATSNERDRRVGIVGVRRFATQNVRVYELRR